MRLKNYYFLHSHRLTGVSHLLIGFRKDIQAAAVPVLPHESEEYVCANTVISTQRFTFIAAYMEPGAAFDVRRLENVIASTSPPHIICGDFNAHNEIWGSARTNSRGARLAELLIKRGIEPLNDGSITYLKNPTLSSCIDLSFASNSFIPKFTWCTDLQTRGSDHFPILISYQDVAVSRREIKFTRTDWEVFKNRVDEEITAATSDKDLIPTMARCLKESSSVVRRRLDVKKDEEYERLRAIRRRAEQKARRTKELEDLRQARKAQRLVRRYLEKLSRQRWRDFCTKLDVHQPLSRIWRVLKGMRKDSQQLHLFRALSLHEGISQKEAAEGYCRLLSTISTPQVSPPRVPDAAPPTSLPALDLPYSIGELNAAISNVKKRSSPGYDGITYEAVSNLSHHSRLRLLECCVVLYLQNGKQPKLQPS